LEKAAKRRIEKVIYQILLWQDGNFQFELDDLDINNKIESKMWDGKFQKVSARSTSLWKVRVYMMNLLSRTLLQEKKSREKLQKADGKQTGEASPLQRERYLSPEVIDTGIKVSQFSVGDNPSHTQICKRYFPSRVLFMVGENELTGLGQFGLEIERADEKVRETKISTKDSQF